MATQRGDSPRDILARNRQAALALAEQAGKTRTLTLLRAAQDRLTKRLRTAEGLTGGADRFTAQRLKIAMEQVKLTVRELSGGLRGVLTKTGRLTSDTAVRNLVSYMNAAEAKYRGIGHALALRPAMMLDRVGKKTEASVLARIEGTPGHEGRPGVLRRYGSDVIQRFEERMLLGVATETSWEDMQDEITEESEFLKGAPRHWAERIVRTETMAAYNRASLEGVREAQQALGDCVKILVATFDDRTSWDSYQVHGQIRRPEEAFEWSQGSFMYPPNRPNDRETVITHRVSWPIPPELEPKSDGEVEARYRQERPKGPGPGARPNMSTVDRKLFGKVDEPTPTPTPKPEPEPTPKPEPKPEPAPRRARKKRAELPPDPVPEKMQVQVEVPEGELPEHQVDHWMGEYAHLGDAARSVAHGRAAQEYALDMPAEKALAFYKEIKDEWLVEQVKTYVQKDKLKTLRDLQKKKDWAEEASMIAAIAGHAARIKTKKIDVPTAADPAGFMPRVAKKVNRAHAYMEKLCAGTVNHKRSARAKMKVNIEENRKRANYSEHLNQINAGPYVETQTILHEWGHGIESNNPSLAYRAQEFLEKRTKGEKEKRLKALFPHLDYKDDEITTPDKFINAYVGKRYRSGGRTYATEVTSMGVENLYKNPRSFFRADPEHFYFTLGQLAGMR